MLLTAINSDKHHHHHPDINLYDDEEGKKRWWGEEEGIPNGNRERGIMIPVAWISEVKSHFFMTRDDVLGIIRWSQWMNVDLGIEKNLRLKKDTILTNLHQEWSSSRTTLKSGKTDNCIEFQNEANSYWIMRNLSWTSWSHNMNILHHVWYVW